MGLQPSKVEYARTIDEGTSSRSLSDVRYIEVEKPKWKVFRTKEIHAVPFTNERKYPKTCDCGQEGKCKQKTTPSGVTMHYPQKSKKRIVNLPNVRVDKDTIKCTLPPPPPVQKDNSIPKTGGRVVKDMALNENPEQPPVLEIQTGETQLAVQVEHGRHSLTLLIDVTKLPDQDGKYPRKLPFWRVENMECNGRQYKVSLNDRIAAPKKVPKEPPPQQQSDPNNSPDTKK